MAKYLSSGGLGEPQSPLVHQRVLDVEVVFVMEDCDLVALSLVAAWLLVLVGGAATGGDGDGREVDLGGGIRIAIDRWLGGGGSHDRTRVDVERDSSKSSGGWEMSEAN